MRLSLLNEGFTDDEMDTLKQFDGAIVDQKDINGYEIYLINMKSDMFNNDLKLQLAIQQVDKSIWSHDDQHEKTKFDPRSLASTIKPLKDVITMWLSKYGPIAIASLNGKKTHQWARLIKHVGFNIKPKKFHGMPYYVMSLN